MAAVEVPSLAREAYSILAGAERSAPSEKYRQHLEALKKLDPSIPKD